MPETPRPDTGRKNRTCHSVPCRGTIWQVGAGAARKTAPARKQAARGELGARRQRSWLDDASRRDAKSPRRKDDMLEQTPRRLSHPYKEITNHDQPSV